MAAPAKSTTAFTGLGTITHGNTSTSQWVNLSTTFEAKINMTVTVTTAWTVGTTITVDVSPDNGTTVYSSIYTLTGPSSGSAQWNVPQIDLSDATMYARVNVTNNNAANAISASGNVTHIDTVA